MRISADDKRPHAMATVPSLVNKALAGLIAASLIALVAGCSDQSTSAGSGGSMGAVDTGQSLCYDDTGAAIPCPASGSRFHGQDAQYAGVQPAYRNNGDGTVSDLNTGLMWQQAHNATRISGQAAEAACNNLELGGYTDWRLPTIKELFSLADFRGNQHARIPYIDTAYFDIDYADDIELTGTHRVEMMGQTWSGTFRPDRSDSLYFFNFFDGHIKSSFYQPSGSVGELFYRCVRGNAYGINAFSNHGDGTVSDMSTGLMWQQANAEQSPGDYQFNWEEALDYCESLSLAGHDDWRLPNIKELQSIVDYTRTDPALDTSAFTFHQAPNTAAYFWSGTTHGDTTQFAAYMCFGPCWNYTFSADIHGPGAQRADPKSGNPSAYTSLGDQEDRVQIYNYVRCVR